MQEKFSDAERNGLSALLDEIIPPGRDGRMPGAGQLGLEARIEADLAKQEGLIEVARAGLAALDEASGGSFVELDRSRRRGIVDQVVAAHPALVPSLVFLTYTAYYEHPQVRVGLGRDPRPAHPGGYELEPFDPDLVEQVLRREPLYRKV